MSRETESTHAWRGRNTCRSAQSDDGCQMCHLAGKTEGKVSQTAPITNIGCQKCHLRPSHAAKMAQTAPITNIGCQMCHFRPRALVKKAQTTPITNVGCQTCHLAGKTEGKVSQTAPILQSRQFFASCGSLPNTYATACQSHATVAYER